MHVMSILLTGMGGEYGGHLGGQRD
jgi:hypothetical protein